MTGSGFVGLIAILSAALATPATAAGETGTKPLPAPVGHRQPRAADVSVPPSSPTLDQEDANVDRKISNICRGCLPQQIDPMRTGVARAFNGARSALGSQPQSSRGEGRAIMGPFCSSACIADHGRSECREHVWFYGSSDTLARH
jgi:hypothetical protein